MPRIATQPGSGPFHLLTSTKNVRQNIVRHNRFWGFLGHGGGAAVQDDFFWRHSLSRKKLDGWQKNNFLRSKTSGVVVCSEIIALAIVLIPVQPGVYSGFLLRGWGEIP